MKNKQTTRCWTSLDHVTKERFVTCLSGIGDHHDFEDLGTALSDAEERGCPCVDQYQFLSNGSTRIISWSKGKSGAWSPEAEMPRTQRLTQSWEPRA